MDDQKDESLVGKKLSEYTTKKVIILVLMMLFMSPFSQVEMHLDYHKRLAYMFGLE